MDGKFKRLVAGVIMKILCIGDVVGGPGRRLFKAIVPELRREASLDVVVVNAENAAGGKGITAEIARELFDAGADVITLGDHAWDQKDTPALVAQERRIVRPANGLDGGSVFVQDWPGCMGDRAAVKRGLEAGRC